MKKMFVAFLFVLVLCSYGYSWAAGGGNQIKCPVQGYKIDEKLFADYQGKRVYFCCESCIGEFQKDPAMYMKQLESQGVQAEKVP